MSVSHSLSVLGLLFLSVPCTLELVFSAAAHCDHSPKILQQRQGEIHNSAHHSWSSRPLNCSWLITSKVGERVIISFSQFNMRCGREWVSVVPLTGNPYKLCGFQLPAPFEMTGGNITVTHHFLTHFYPVTGFRLSYIKDSGPCFPGEFECYSDRCLPASWRCNGRVECLGVGDELGSDEDGCDYVSPEPPIDDVNHLPPAETTTLGILLSSTDVPPPKIPDFHLLPQGGPCGGYLRAFYGSFTPPFQTGQPVDCVWTVDPQDSRPLKLELQQLELGPRDMITITDQPHGTGNIIKTINSVSNNKAVDVESHTGLLSLIYHMEPSFEGRGFNATYRITDYCLPWEELCGGSLGGCYTRKQRCDGHWDCPETGLDEEGCWGCEAGHFLCGMGGIKKAGHQLDHPVCFSIHERCNYQLNCADGTDERECTICQPGTFHCDSDRCVFESWRCDGQVDCKDGTDELNCTVTLPRKVITAATVGSLVCGLLLVIAMGCTCKLYSLRTREYSMFAPITRQEAELIQQQAPPSYGQLIAQGIIPPVEDFPTENPNETVSLSLRGILQLLRQDNASSLRRRRRPRFVRRAVRRLRRWGLLPRPAPRPTQTTASSSQQTEASNTSTEPSQSSPGVSSVATDAASQPLPQKLCLSQQTETQQQAEAPPPPSPPPPFSVQPIEEPGTQQTPPIITIPPSSPSLASLFHTLGRSISRFRTSPSPTSLPLSASPSFSSSSSEDEVLLIPLSDDTTSEDDVPMLT
ncbi:low-density lipoprotein receptor-related protein 10 [Ctenopharyngodon idella]|uniref:low-density lipoprotein receptor-related protein 10 n=1 Tax=Ctenopharyngodon idella TaxID=7959 RepID=UPI00222FB944|nr:low-density lipoprotein receptor-related protein 10 [Ctenopharyngodon idella]XP_051754869.1 low-density lipoprotein receptor-related protein 10 [Ctenopharyngodon idella]